MKLFNVLMNVLFIFALGNSILSIVVMVLWYGAGIDYWTPLAEGVSRAWPIILFGCVAVAFAIYDGQLVGSVKPSGATERDAKGLPMLVSANASIPSPMDR